MCLLSHPLRTADASVLALLEFFQGQCADYFQNFWSIFFWISTPSFLFLSLTFSQVPRWRRIPEVFQNPTKLPHLPFSVQRRWVVIKIDRRRQKRQGFNSRLPVFYCQTFGLRGQKLSQFVEEKNGHIPWGCQTFGFYGQKLSQFVGRKNVHSPSPTLRWGGQEPSLVPPYHFRRYCLCHFLEFF